MSEKIKTALGHGKILATEHKIARQLGRFFFNARIVVTLWLVVQWYLELNNLLPVTQIYLANFLIWIYFIIETILLLTFVNNKKFYILQNWPVTIIIISGICLLFYPHILAGHLFDGLRLILIIWLLIPWLEVCFNSLSDNYFTTTLLTAFFIILFSGIIISGLDPSIESAWDGIWWAWVTVTTVGYGDVVPTSFVGRAFAFILIMMGLVLFAAFTANFSALFIKRRLGAGYTKEEDNSKKIISELNKLSSKISELETLVKKHEK